MTNKLINDLLKRIPELEWQLEKLGNAFLPNSLPDGLFRQPFDAPISSYITELKTEINSLAKHENQLAANYLAARINQKINVLVTMCYRHNQKHPSRQATSFGVDALTTRQQWLQSLEASIQLLINQKEAIINTLELRQKQGDPNVLLGLQRELGEVEKRLTLAEETYSKAIG